MRCLSNLLGATFLAVLAHSAARADGAYVQTPAGRLEGRLVFASDHVAIGEKQVAWDDVLYLLANRPARTLPKPHAVRFKNGEVWCGVILSLAGKRLEIETDWFGPKKVDIASVAALEFTPGARLENVKADTLYREKGEPVPGKLLAIDKDKLTMESPLGTVNIPREGLTRYVILPVTVPATDAQAPDEIALADGSIFRGKMKPAAGKLPLEHPLLGELALPTNSVRSVVRSRPGFIDLTDLSPKSAETAPLIAGAAPPARWQSIRGDGDDATFVKALRIEAKTTVRYELPKRDGQKLMFAANVQPVGGARGSVRVRLAVGEETVFDKELAAGEKALPLSLELPQGDSLSIEVDFGPAIRFPAGVNLGDPHLLLRK